jgi:hypothetical protein
MIIMIITESLVVFIQSVIIPYCQLSLLMSVLLLFSPAEAVLTVVVIVIIIQY